MAAGGADLLRAWLVAHTSDCGGGVLDAQHVTAFSEVTARAAAECMSTSGSHADMHGKVHGGSVETLLPLAGMLGSVMQLVRGSEPHVAMQPVTAAAFPTGRGAPPAAQIWPPPGDQASLIAVAERLSAALLEPPAWAHIEAGSTPALPASEEQRAASARHLEAACAAMRALSGLVPGLALPQLHDGSVAHDRSGGATSSASASGAGGARAAKAAGGGDAAKRTSHAGGRVIIEEVGNEDVEAEARGAREWLLVHQLLLLVATYSRDERLFSPWLPLPDDTAGTAAAAAPVEEAARQLLAALALATCSARGADPPGATPSGSASLMRPGEARGQALLAAALPELLPPLRRALVAAQPSAEFGASRPPGSSAAEASGVASLIPPMPTQFERAVAARRAAFLVRSTRHPFIGALVPLLLPALLTLLDDTAACVSAHGVWGLHHVAGEALPSDVLYQRELLLDTVRRLVVGCDEALWGCVLPAAVATVRALEGRDATAPGYHMLASELLTETERSFHKRGQRLPLLAHLGPLVDAMGLATTRHMARLMPLLLESLHAFDAPSRASSSRLLLTVVRATWERVPAHAVLLWRHMLSAWARDAPQLLGGDDAAAGAEAVTESAAMEARPFGTSRSSTGSAAGAGLCAYMQSMQSMLPRGGV
ncbi:hypothetical protein FOA52_008956 [Chlamydomonas sp. UWO 241]|nr:hypothetical protein FOA52_008956 [Chlamydomonas sp. UWO 241]